MTVTLPSIKKLQAKIDVSPLLFPSQGSRTNHKPSRLQLTILEILEPFSSWLGTVDISETLVHKALSPTILYLTFHVLTVRECYNHYISNHMLCNCQTAN